MPNPFTNIAICWQRAPMACGYAGALVFGAMRQFATHFAIIGGNVQVSDYLRKAKNTM